LIFFWVAPVVDSVKDIFWPTEEFGVVRRFAVQEAAEVKQDDNRAIPESFPAGISSSDVNAV